MYQMFMFTLTTDIIPLRVHCVLGRAVDTAGGQDQKQKFFVFFSFFQITDFDTGTGKT